MTKTTYEPTSDLDLFAKRLVRSATPKNTLEHSPTANELTDLRLRLDVRLRAGRMDLKLLALEWRYDVALLLDHMRHWMFQLDRDFNG
ncbi:hypothetical protein HGP16_26090 [Rhizobium sp. P40RR-XXII]|uniref:hypothetical protein n=1 Tax=unclassified Rhizobium TaxID=2613769 RepID=UPI0014577425|nr:MULTISPECIES: hypothetical protein [unclassified Rhizobium]NLR85356.1 hypothetical protein [Rhizobium sp. P28RR-XV]NLS20012.1 hypothetical protein [Rhizobium sp. P40RR-XXII]